MMSLNKSSIRDAPKASERNEPLISIIIVTYNAGKFIQPCIDSIIAQRFKNYELIIQDGASNDDTVELIKKNEQNITYWQSEPDKGIYDAMNKALVKASGKWFYFLGIDDLLLPGFSEMAEKLQQSNTIYTGNCITDKGALLDGNFAPYRLTKMNVSHQAIFYPAAVFKKYHYQLRYKIYADYVLNLQCWGDSSFRIKYFPVDIALYHTGGFSSFLEDEIFKQDKDFLIKKYFSPFVYLRYRFKQWKDKKKGKLKS